VQRPFLDFPEATAKVVENLRVYSNPPSGREVHIKFSDGTALSIEIDVRSAVSGRYYRDNQGDIEVIRERRDLPSHSTDT
jgi:hypothetical protein